MKSGAFHLPFSDKWDLSNDDAEEALADDRKLIEAAEKAGIRVAVIHPSFEPIPEADRAKRIENAKKNLKLLNQTAKEHGIVLTQVLRGGSLGSKLTLAIRN